MGQRWFLSLSSFVLLSSFSMGQMSTLPAAQAIADLPGPPKNPPIFSQMTVIWQGGLQYQNTINMKGSVASVEREEAQSPDQNPNPYHTTSKCKFDEDGHLGKCVNEDYLGVIDHDKCFGERKAAKPKREPSSKRWEISRLE